MPREIRLACFYCDTDECDGVDEVPPGWTEVEEFQSYAASLEDVSPNDPTAFAAGVVHASRRLP